jgi:SAM-dependent methyltransferase
VGSIQGMNAFDAYEAAGWADRAGAYTDFLAPVTARAGRMLMASAGVGPGRRVVDVGSGPGDLAAACTARGARVVGVDIAQEMVVIARQRHPGIDFRQGDAQDLALEDRSVDIALGNFVILHIGRPEAAVAELARVLDAGGTAGLTTWDAPDRCRLVGVFVDAVAAVGPLAPAGLPAGPAFFRFADDSAFASLVCAAGFIDVRVDTIGFEQRFAGPDELWDGMLGATVRTRDLVLGQPPEVQVRIRQAYDHLVGGYVGDDGAVRIPVSVKLVLGRRP